MFQRADQDGCSPEYGGCGNDRPAYRCAGCRRDFCNACTDTTLWDGIHCPHCGESTDTSTLRLPTGAPGLIHIGARLEHHTHWLEQVGTHTAVFGGRTMPVHPLTISLSDQAEETLGRHAQTVVWKLEQYRGGHATLSAARIGPELPG